ncbi:MAG: hypothetical protein GXY89_00605, partial [Tissierellia bacterium]|nr:hypothetical protein [Tissierellia bacterium]
MSEENSLTRSLERISRMINSQSFASALNDATRASAQINRLIKDSLYEGLVEKIIDLSTYIELDLDKFEAYEENLLEEENNYKSVLYPKLSSDDSLNKLHDINNKIDKLIDGFNAVEKKIDSNKEYTT